MKSYSNSYFSNIDYVTHVCYMYIGNKIAYFRSEYNISVKHNTFSEGVNLIKKSAQLCEELQLTIDHIWSLILVKSNNYSIEGFDLTEINDMISFLTTN